MDSNFVLYNLCKLIEPPTNVVYISSSELGDVLGVSQQTASRYINKLKKKGMIERRIIGRKQEIFITPKGLNALKKIYHDIGDFISKKMEIVISGRVVIGIGEGAYYIKEYAEKIKQKLGFKPFYGTLNVRVNEKSLNLDKFASTTIDGFREKNRSFGNIKLLPVELAKNKRNTNCYLLIPERAHHDENEIEFISNSNLRKKLRLKDEDSVRIKILG